MESRLGLRVGKSNSSPLEGSDAFRAQQAESVLRQLARREWWLWFSALFVATRSALGFVLSSVPSLFRHSEHFYEILSDHARWVILCLVLAFYVWILFLQSSVLMQRRQLIGQ